MSKAISCCDLVEVNSTLYPQITAAVAKVIECGNYILGPEVATFEKNFASAMDSKYAVGVANGTDALVLALMALDVGPGDEVITTSYTALATIAAIAQTGAKAVLMDVNCQTYTMDCCNLESLISPNTKAVIAVHLYGYIADLGAILKICDKHSIPLIEDCAQATGAIFKDKAVGSWGSFGCFSFYPTKNLGALGDGGLITTQSKQYADKLHKLRQYGWDDKRHSHISGINSRLDEMQAAILNCKLPYLSTHNANRIALADYYLTHLNSKYIYLPTWQQHAVWHLFVIRCINPKIRQQLLQHAKTQDIHLAIHYPLPAHRHPGYAHSIITPVLLQHSEQISTTVVSLPLYPGLSQKQQDKVIACINGFNPRPIT